MNENQANHLIHESSPYLLQHARNPVDWYPWSEEALNRAREENKPILLSIGYSSCHWCHVMAHESFEDPEIAAIMNENFINIKLDREERPDIDNIYMDAIQNMGLRGGWPLNVFLTADQKPFYGGTYFPPEQWKKLLLAVSEAYTNKYDQLYESAVQFAESIQESPAQKYGTKDKAVDLEQADFDSIYSRIAAKFDTTWGGLNGAPKFPMPAIWNYLLTQGTLIKNETSITHVLFTLDQLVSGGIYDQIGGGFSRYSVDAEWHVPHFEKMLYDNGQLLGLYAKAFKLTNSESYRRVIMQTVDWVQREMTDPSGGFYSALDADSEGEEGRFYVWSYDEIKQLAGTNFNLISTYYNVSKQGNWEEGKNVLRVINSPESLLDEFNMDLNQFFTTIDQFRKKALDQRAERVRPGLDNKIIAGWNGLMLSGLCEAFQATGSDKISELALENAAFIRNNLIEDNRLLRVKNQPMEGYLEDYAAVIQAFIDLYETFHNESDLKLASDLTNHVIGNFYDNEEKLFYFSSASSETLIARKKELFDNVIPSSNSMMVENIYRLGILLDNEQYTQQAWEMILPVNSLIKKEAEYLSNWARISLQMNLPTAEIIVIGDDFDQVTSQIQNMFIPNKVLLAAKEATGLALMEYKSPIDDKTTIYVCFDKVCKRPAFTVEDALDQLEKVR